MSKTKLKPGFDPIWQSEILDLRKISCRAFILRQIYRLYRNTETNLCNISDLTISRITGWDRKTIRSARRELIESKDLLQTAYHTYQIKHFHQLETWGETPQPGSQQHGEKLPNHLGRNSSTLGEKLPNHLGKNSPTYPISDNKTDITDICGNCFHYEKEHLDNRGNVTSWCPILKAALPPNINAASCQHYQKKEEKCQK